MTEANLLKVQNFSLGYHTSQGELVQVLRHIDLDIQAGDAIGLVGESGCGKSTLALALMGFLRSGSQILSGDVQYQGHNLFNLSDQQLAKQRGGKIGLIPQNAGQSLTPTLKIKHQLFEALQLHSHLHKSEWHKRAMDLLSYVCLPAPEAIMERYPHQLSGGQQQRVAIAMALAGKPDILILDEPTTGLDVTTQARILSFLHYLREQLGTAMVFVSHDLGAVARISDKIAVMYAGEIIEFGSCREVLRSPGHPYSRALLASIPRLSQNGLPPSLAGYPPRIIGAQTGCAFAPRCQHADDICPQKTAILHQEQGRALRCHKAQDLLGQTADVSILKTIASPKLETHLSLQNVGISYRKRQFMDYLRPPKSETLIVDEIDLDIKRGETLALVGESGSGKTTIMRAISGIHPAQKGQIDIAGTDYNRPVEKRESGMKRRVQMIFQNPDASLNPRHTVFEILQQPLRLYFGYDSKNCYEKAVELLSLVRLGPHYLDRLPNQLSGGEKQRVAIARCFAGDPELILCDEVTSALDVSVQAAILRLLKELQQKKQVTYLFIAHDLAVVRAFADKIAILYQGRLCQTGTVADIFGDYRHPYTDMLLNSILEPDPDAYKTTYQEDIAESHPPGKGCAYQRRCSYVSDKCVVETPPWHVQGQNRIHCHKDLTDLANLFRIDTGHQSVSA